MNPSELSPEALKIILGLVITFGGSFITLVWKIASWKMQIEKDLASLGEKLGTERGIAEMEKIRRGRRKYDV